MKFTGGERFTVQRGNRKVLLRLADITADEVLGLANELQRSSHPEHARALFAYQAQRRGMETELAQMTAAQIDALLLEVKRTGDPKLLETLRASLARMATDAI